VDERTAGPSATLRSVGMTIHFRGLRGGRSFGFGCGWSETADPSASLGMTKGKGGLLTQTWSWWRQQGEESRACFPADRLASVLEPNRSSIAQPISPWSIQVPLSCNSSTVSTCLLCVLAICAPAMAQAPATVPPATFTADQDRQNMMDQLGIKACPMNAVIVRCTPRVYRSVRNYEWPT
jgi:hypothetical protein